MVNVDMYKEDTKKEKEAFKRVLYHYFSGKEMDYYNPRILNICCGAVTEEPVLFQYFGKDSELISLDNDERFEEIAAQLGRESFRLGDVRDLKDYVEGKFDIVIGRNVPLNPNYDTLHKIWRNVVTDHWPETFGKLIMHMHAGSTLFLTLARDDEVYRAKEILDCFRYSIRTIERNRIIVPSSYIGVKGSDTKDRFVIVAQPPKMLQMRLSWD